MYAGEKVYNEEKHQERMWKWDQLGGKKYKTLKNNDVFQDEG